MDRPPVQSSPEQPHVEQMVEVHERRAHAAEEETRAQAVEQAQE